MKYSLKPVLIDTFISGNTVKVCAPEQTWKGDNPTQWQGAHTLRIQAPGTFIHLDNDPVWGGGDSTIRGPPIPAAPEKRLASWGLLLCLGKAGSAGAPGTEIF